MARMDRGAALTRIHRAHAEAPVRPVEALSWMQVPQRVVDYGERVLEAAQAMPRTKGKQELVDAAMALIATGGRPDEVNPARYRLDDAVYQISLNVRAHYQRASRRRRSRR